MHEVSVRLALERVLEMREEKGVPAGRTAKSSRTKASSVQTPRGNWAHRVQVLTAWCAWQGVIGFIWKMTFGTYTGQ